MFKLFNKNPGCAPAYEISGRMDRMSATETVDHRSIPGRIKPKTIEIGIYSNLSLTLSNQKGQCEASTLCGRQVAA